MSAVFKFLIAINLAVYKITKGALGGSLVGLGVLLLTTTGRKSKKLITRPLGFFPDGDKYVIIASNGGSDSHPNWLFNIQENPRVRVQIKGREFGALAKPAPEPERTRLWEKLVELSPWYIRYAEKTKRVIPMVVLTPQ
jgi:deazaflavin-dependent oxidoreductase (nitroreductase family)